MNSFTLLGQVCNMWLTEPEQSQLSARDAEALLLAVNSAVRSVWNAMPMQSRTRPLSVRFYEPLTASISTTPKTDALLAKSISSDLLEGCSITLNDDRVEHTLYQKNATQYSTFHPYMGGITGTQQAKIWRDVYLLNYQLERFTKPMVDISSGVVWEALTNSLSPLTGNRYRVEVGRTFAGFKTMIRIPKSDTMRVFSSEAIIRPYELRLEDSQTAVDLPYEEDVAQWAVQSAGYFLRQHTKLRVEMKAEAETSLNTVLDHIKSVVTIQSLSIDNPIGPPIGW